LRHALPVVILRRVSKRPADLGEREPPASMAEHTRVLGDPHHVLREGPGGR
jgi:hypothetical protein